MDFATKKALRHCPLFKNQSLEHLQVITREFRKGQQVSDMLEGKPYLGIVTEGKLMVYSLAYDGNEQSLSILTKGDCFGICNIFAQSPMPTYLKCKTTVSVVYIEKEQFIQLMRENSEIAINYAALCNQKILFLTDKIESGHLTSCKNK